MRRSEHFAGVGADVLMEGRIGETIQFYYLDTEPLLKVIFESGTGHAVDLSRCGRTRSSRDTVRILAVGDSFFPTGVFRRALERLESEHSVDYLQVDASRTPPDLPIREYEGDPAEIAAHMPGVDALVVHGAPVVDEVLAASEALRLICCARGGPVNVDLGAASARGLPVVTTPGKERRLGRRSQTLAFLVDAREAVPACGNVFPGSTGAHCRCNRRSRARSLRLTTSGGHTLGLVGVRPTSANGSPAAHALSTWRSSSSTRFWMPKPTAVSNRSETFLNCSHAPTSYWSTRARRRKTKTSSIATRSPA